MKRLKAMTMVFGVTLAAALSVPAFAAVTDNTSLPDPGNQKLEQKLNGPKTTTAEKTGKTAVDASSQIPSKDQPVLLARAQDSAGVSSDTSEEKKGPTQAEIDQQVMAGLAIGCLTVLLVILLVAALGSSSGY